MAEEQATQNNGDLPRWTYFVQIGADGPIKIGSSLTPLSRMRQLQAGLPWELRLLGTTRDPIWCEAELQQRFSHLRMRGEWFSPGEDLLAFVREHTSPHAPSSGSPPSPQRRKASSKKTRPRGHTSQKQAAVLAAIREPGNDRLPHTEIARTCGVSEYMVRRFRAEMSPPVLGEAEERAAIQRIIDDPKWENATNHAIAEAAGASDSLVSEMRYEAWSAHVESVLRASMEEG